MDFPKTLSSICCLFAFQPRINEGKSSHRKVRVKRFIENPEKEIFSVKFNNDDSLVAVAMSEGMIDIYNFDSGKKLFSLESSPDGMPTTCLRCELDIKIKQKYL